MDDEEELVREVISENPPEDRGVRPEWESHQGWHRVEDTHPNDVQTEGKQGEKFLADQALGGNHAVHVATDQNANDDDPLEPLDEGKSGEKSNDPIAEEIIPGTAKALQGNELKREVALGSLPRTVRGVNVGKGDIAYERATTNIRKPLTIGLAAVVFFAYVTFQRRRLMKSTKDML